MALTDERMKHIEEMRAKLADVLDKFSAEDMQRVHAKFFGACIAIEVAFERRFPAEWAVYKREVYGDDE